MRRLAWSTAPSSPSHLHLFLIFSLSSHFSSFFFQGGAGSSKSKFFNAFFFFCDWTTSKLKGQKSF